MAESARHIRGMGYVPGRAHGILHRGSSGEGSIAMLGQREAVGITARPAGLTVVDGSPLSHGMIGLVARGIPTVIIDAAQAVCLRPGDEVWIDGATGLISCGVEGGGQSMTIPPVPRVGEPAVRLRDGTAVWLLASIRSASGASQAVAEGAGAIGLVRSEFLGHDQTQPPDTGYFMREPEDLCVSAGTLAVTVRLVDLAADKPPRWLPEGPDILRPLGMQGARLFGRERVRSVLRSQLEALAAVSRRFPLEVLIPYLGSREELVRWGEFVCRSLPDGVPVGAMVETPAALMDLANWCDLADFFAVGCNDLMQCLFGADRDEPALRGCLDPYAPVLYRLLAQAADSASGQMERIRLCGVLPRFAGVLPVLVGLGYRQFSVDPAWIPYLAQNLHEVSLDDSRQLAREVCACRESSEVRERLGLQAAKEAPC